MIIVLIEWIKIEIVLRKYNFNTKLFIQPLKIVVLWN